MAHAKAVGIIPARLNSSRFPRKLLHKIKNKTLIEHTLEQAITYEALDDLFIATDSYEIAQIAQKRNVKVIMTSSQPKTGTERVIEATLSNKHLQNTDIVVNIQGDHPFISPQTIKKIVTLLRENPSFPIATAVSSFKGFKKALNPHIVKCVFDQNQTALYFSRSPIPYSKDENTAVFHQHLGVYAYHVLFLHQLKTTLPSPLEEREGLEQMRFMENGAKIKIAITQDTPQGVETPQDILICEKLLCQ